MEIYGEFDKITGFDSMGYSPVTNTFKIIGVSLVDGRKQTKKDMKFFYDVEKIIKLSIRKNLVFLNSLEMAKTFSSFNKDLSHSNINSKLDEKRDIEIAKFNQQNKTLFECLRYLKQFKKDFLKEYRKMGSRDEFKALEEKWLEILHKELKSRLGEK